MDLLVWQAPQVQPVGVAVTTKLIAACIDTCAMHKCLCILVMPRTALVEVHACCLMNQGVLRTPMTLQCIYRWLCGHHAHQASKAAVSCNLRGKVRCFILFMI